MPVITHLSKPIKGTTQRMSPNVNYELQLIIIYWPVSHNMCTTLMQAVNNIGNWEWGWGDIWEFPVLASPFFCESKTSLKNKIYLINVKCSRNIRSCKERIDHAFFLCFLFFFKVLFMSKPEFIKLFLCEEEYVVLFN